MALTFCLKMSAVSFDNNLASFPKSSLISVSEGSS